MGYELVIEGNVFVKEGLSKCCIGIDGGVIRSVKKVLKGERHLDVGDKLVLPAAIDPHVHFRDPGLTDKEDFSTGSLAAVFGGVTTVLDMPNTRPAITSAGRLKDKFEAIKGRSHVDYGLFLGLAKATDIAKAARLASGLKVFLGETTGEMVVEDDDQLRKGLSQAAAHDLPVTVHCEATALMAKGDRPPGNTLEYNRSRPEAIELMAVRRLASLPEAAKARVHIAHVSHVGTLDALKPGWTTEVTPHHMLLTASKSLKGKGKMNPPLREEPTTTELRMALFNGRIDISASDHAPHTLEEKQLPFHDAPAGVPGVETMAPLLFMSLRGQHITVKRLVEAISHRTATIFGIKGKGHIAPGMDADIMTVDMREVTTIKAGRLHSRCGWSPFEGHEAIFPKNVFLRGQQLVQDRELVGDDSFGRPLKDAKEGRTDR